MAAADRELIAFRCACGKKLKLPAAAAGRLAKCPKCGQGVRVPHTQVSATTPPDADVAAPPATGAADATTAAPANDRLTLDDLLLDEAASPALPRAVRQAAPAVGRAASPTTPATLASGGPRPGDPGDMFELAPLPPEQKPGEDNVELTQKCPSCGRGWPGSAKICTDCGVYITTGRSLVTTQEDTLDETYMRAQSTIWWLSWIMPFLGIYPIASEAFGLRKPYVIRAILLVTFLVSVVFFFSLWSDPITGGPLGHLLLWGGDRDSLPVDFADLAAKLRDSGVPEAQVADYLEKTIRELLHSLPEHHAYQYLTHQFLHADFWHLAGNMLFLFVLGSRVNALIGQALTAVLYPVLGVAAAAIYMVTRQDQSWGAMLGASGAISGLAGMYLVFFPQQRVHLALFTRMNPLKPIMLTLHFFTLRGYWFVVLFWVWDVAYILLGSETGVAHWAHLGGFGAGVIGASLLLVTRMVNGRGADIFSTLFGRRAWWLVGRPRSAA